VGITFSERTCGFDVRSGEQAKEHDELLSRNALHLGRLSTRKKAKKDSFLKSLHSSFLQRTNFDNIVLNVLNVLYLLRNKKNSSEKN